MPRPPFIISTADVQEKADSYPHSHEVLGYGRAIGRTAGLKKIGLHLVRLPPGQRTSWPHAEETEEEFVYVLDGAVDAWIDGTIHPMQAGDLAAFPSGTGIYHTFINNGDREARLLHPHRRREVPAGQWWSDIPLGPQGPHDGKPDALRTKGA